MKKAGEKGAIPGISKNALTVLEKRYLKRDTTGKALETPADMFRRVATAIASADSNFNPKADVAALSDKFYQLMTNALGQSIAGHLWSRRLERAATDLRDPRRNGLSVAQIAFANGFEDAAHFTRAFKRRYAVTPGQWRLN